MTTREQELRAMKGPQLIEEADRLGVRVAADRNKNKLVEAKAKVVERILVFEAEIGHEAELDELTAQELADVEEKIAAGKTFDEAIKAVTSKEEEVEKEETEKTEEADTIPEGSTTQSEEFSEEPKQNTKAAPKKSNLRLSELTYNNETKSIREWAAELDMPWATLYDRVNRNGWTVEEALETPLGQRRKK